MVGTMIVCCVIIYDMNVRNNNDLKSDSWGASAHNWLERYVLVNCI